MRSKGGKGEYDDWIKNVLRFILMENKVILVL